MDQKTEELSIGVFWNLSAFERMKEGRDWSPKKPNCPPIAIKIGEHFTPTSFIVVPDIRDRENDFVGPASECMNRGTVYGPEPFGSPGGKLL